MTKNSDAENRRPKKSKSLSVRTIRYTVLGCVLFGLIAELIGVSLYGTALSREYIQHAFDTASSVSNSVQRGADSVGLAQAVMEVYNSLTPEQRAQTGTPEYSAYYSHLDTSKGSAHDILIHMLGGYINSTDVSDVYLAMFDLENSALVYMVDPQEENQFQLGEWEPVEKREARKFLNWNGEGSLYDISNTESYGWLCTAGVPIRNAAGEICAFVLADVGIGAVIAGMAAFTLQITLALLAVTALIAWFMSRRIKKTVVTPINAIAEAAQAYVRDKREGATVTDRFGSLNIHSSDEMDNLCQIMADMERSLSEHEEQIIRISAEKERIGTELNMAKRIQASMLPHIFPPYPERKEFDLFASMDPARAVGGDFYDFFLIDNDHLCMIMADVSGKGVPGALFMMVSKVILQSCAMLNQTVGEILNKTNEALCSNNQVEMFVTVWLGVLEISTGKIIAANAGHEYPALYRKSGAFELLKDRHGFVIGGMPGTKYKEYEIQLQPGDKLFLYTDGVPEATNAAEELFGTARMLDALNEKPEAGAKDILTQVRRSVDAFVGDAEQFYDLTMLCLESKGTGEAPAEEQSV